MSISNSRETLKQWKLKLKLIRSLVNHRGFIVDDIKLMFVRIIKKKKKNYGFFYVLHVQYGFVNYALELLVVKTFDSETWEAIK